FSGVPGAALTPMAPAGDAAITWPSARSVSCVDCVEKWNERMTFAGLSASGPSAGLPATSRCDSVKPQAPCIGVFGSDAQFAALAGEGVAPSVVLIVA